MRSRYTSSTEAFSTTHLHAYTTPDRHPHPHQQTADSAGDSAGDSTGDSVRRQECSDKRVVSLCRSSSPLYSQYSHSTHL